MQGNLRNMGNSGESSSRTMGYARRLLVRERDPARNEALLDAPPGLRRSESNESAAVASDSGTPSTRLILRIARGQQSDTALSTQSRSSISELSSDQCVIIDISNEENETSSGLEASSETLESSEAIQCPSSEVSQCPSSEVIQCPSSEAIQCPSSEAIQCPSSEVIQCPSSESLRCISSQAVDSSSEATLCSSSEPLESMIDSERSCSSIDSKKSLKYCTLFTALAKPSSLPILKITRAQSKNGHVINQLNAPDEYGSGDLIRSGGVLPFRMVLRVGRPLRSTYAQRKRNHMHQQAYDAGEDVSDWWSSQLNGHVLSETTARSVQSEYGDTREVWFLRDVNHRGGMRCVIIFCWKSH